MNKQKCKIGVYINSSMDFRVCQVVAKSYEYTVEYCYTPHKTKTFVFDVDNSKCYCRSYHVNIDSSIRMASNTEELINLLDSPPDKEIKMVNFVSTASCFAIKPENEPQYKFFQNLAFSYGYTWSDGVREVRGISLGPYLIFYPGEKVIRWCFSLVDWISTEYTLLTSEQELVKMFNNVEK
jgi:hypothetical protein